MKQSVLNRAQCPSQAQAATPWEPVALRDLSECLLEACDAVACRADELLRARGDAPGNELEDWRRAEAEVLERIPIDVQESDRAITALVSVPGYTASEIELGVDSGWIVILGRHVRSQAGIKSIRSKDTFGPSSDEGVTPSPDFSASRGDLCLGDSVDDERPNSRALINPQSGELESGRSVARQLFGILELPVAVDPARSCAVVHDGLLGIRMLKAEPGSLPSALVG